MYNYGHLCIFFRDHAFDLDDRKKTHRRKVKLVYQELQLREQNQLGISTRLMRPDCSIMSEEIFVYQTGVALPNPHKILPEV